MFPRALISALFALAACASTAAAHFSAAFVDTELKDDSVRVTVQADVQDLMNTVKVFPYYFGASDSTYRLYEDRLEWYLQQKTVVEADGRRLYLAVVQWKPGGKGRGDGFDSVSLRTDYHSVTLGGKLPKGTKLLTVRSDMWNEIQEEGRVPANIEYGLFQGGVALKRAWTQAEKPVRFPIDPASISRMRQEPPPAGIKRLPVDHSGHNE